MSLFKPDDILRMISNDGDDKNSNDDVDVDLANFLELASHDVNFDEMEQDIQRFASNPSVRAVLEKGYDLQNYGSKIQSNLEEAEVDSINDFLNQVDYVKKLNEELTSCNKELQNMENLLEEFKNSLGQVSTDINMLQTQSSDITIKLNNRKKVEEYLSEFTSQITITKDFSDKINDGPVDTSYVKLLKVLSEKLQFIHRKEVRSYRAVKEASVSLDKLRVKAANNIRKWIISKVNELRDLYGIDRGELIFGEQGGLDIPDKLSIQNSMIRCRFLFKFLIENSPDVQLTSRNYYVDVVSRIYLEAFRNETRRIQNQMAQISMSMETLIPSISPQNQRQSIFSRFILSNDESSGSSSNLLGKPSTLFFSLGDRLKLLNDILAPPQIFTLDSYPVETLLRSLYQTLIDSVTSEHTFSTEFFLDDNITTDIFNPTTNELEFFLDRLLAKINDPICIALLLRFSVAHKAEMEHRRVFKIDQHLINVQKKLSERFLQIISMNKAALQNADPNQFVEQKASSKTSHHANAMTKRFTEFAVSLLLLNSKEVEDLIIPQLSDISFSVIDLLERTSLEFKSAEMKDVLMINNLYLICSQFQARIQVQNPESKSLSVIEMFRTKLSDYTSHFVDLEIQISFPALVDTVRKAFPQIESKEQPKYVGFSENELKAIAIDFKENHTKRMSTISESMVLKFGDFQNGGMILQLIARRIVLYWVKFDQLCHFVVKGSPAWFANLISTQQLALNIKPMTDTFYTGNK